MKKCKSPAVLELATGAGKSWIAAAIAKWITENTNKKVLVLQPSKELTEQNYSKWIATGEKASIFSASAGAKCTRQAVVYATPKTVLNSIERFGDMFGCVIVDECHQITPTIKNIISKIKSKNPMLRVIGMTATPYRMNTGYIYHQNLVTNKALSKEEAINPYFAALLYSIKTRELISMGFLTEAHTEPTTDHYNTQNLTINKMGNFDAKQVSSVFENHGRLTSTIVQDVIAKTHDRNGVMLFASTVRHAQEIMESLPPDNSMMLGGDINMDKHIRAKLINDFKAKKFKYIVSVGTLTTGFDAPHVDAIAVLRATESESLFQQIIGRGLRLYDGKHDCLVLDYAGNIARHELHFDIFEPTIQTTKQGTGECIDVVCPACNCTNSFAIRKLDKNQSIDEDGFLLDLAGNKIVYDVDENDNAILQTAHHGRRCNGLVISRLNGEIERCEHRWAFKKCHVCGHENDTAARYCEKKDCRAELVNPNDKLNRHHSTAKRDPYGKYTEQVLFFTISKKISAAGNEVLVCEYTTPTVSFRAFYLAKSSSEYISRKWTELNYTIFGNTKDAVYCSTVDDFIKQHTNQQPETVTYRKNQKTGYIETFGHNHPLSE
jgi:DNA repair protein RadD